MPSVRRTVSWGLQVVLLFEGEFAALICTAGSARVVPRKKRKMVGCMVLVRIDAKWRWEDGIGKATITQDAFCILTAGTGSSKKTKKTKLRQAKCF